MTELTLKPGDKIRCQNQVVTIEKLLYAQLFDWWDVEFIDANGIYRHWKQEEDGGEVIYSV